MKYSVQIKYTNPMHEHVSLRRRVESVTRLVEASSEDEALNRAANQQRALGFLIKEAEVMKEPKEENLHVDEKEKKKKKVVGDDEQETDIASAGGVKEEKGGTESYPLLKKGEKLKPMKLKMGEEVEEVDEAQKKLKPSYWKAEWRLGTQSEVDKNNKKLYDKLAKTDPEKAAKFHDSLMKLRKEEVEQIDERNKENKAKKDAFVSKLGQTEKDRMVKSFSGMKIQKNYGAAAHAKNLKSVKDTHTKTYGRGEVKTDNMPRSKNYRGSYEFSNVGEEVEQIDELKKSTLASYVKKKHDQYHKNRMIAKTQKQVDWLQKDANKNLARAEKRLDPKGPFANSKFIKSEEVESVEESVATAQKVMDRAKVVANTNPDPKKRFAASGLAQKAMLRTINPTGVNTGITRGGGNKTYRMVTGKVPPYQLTKKTGVSEEVEQIDEVKAVRAYDKEGKLVGQYRSMEHAKQMKPGHTYKVDESSHKPLLPAQKAVQAKVDAESKKQLAKKPQAGTLAAQKTRKAAEKMVNKAKGKANKINLTPEIEPGKPNA